MEPRPAGNAHLGRELLGLPGFVSPLPGMSHLEFYTTECQPSGELFQHRAVSSQMRVFVGRASVMLDKRPSLLLYDLILMTPAKTPSPNKFTLLGTRIKAVAHLLGGHN